MVLGIPQPRPRVMFAREAHARGADLKAVQSLLGDSIPTMTMHYIAADLNAMQAALRQWGRRRQQGHCRTCASEVPETKGDASRLSWESGVGGRNERRPAPDWNAERPKSPLPRHPAVGHQILICRSSAEFRCPAARAND